MDYVTAIVPSLGVLFLFVIAIRAIFQADRRERLAQARMDRSPTGEGGPEQAPVEGRFIDSGRPPGDDSPAE